MKVVFLFALIAVASAMPAPEAEADPAADPQVLLTHPLTYTYPVVKPIEVKTKTVPLTYTYTHGLPLTYSYGSYPFGFYPYSYPLVVKAAEAEEAAVEEA